MEAWGWRAWVLRDYCGENATLHSEWDGKLQWVLSRGMTWSDICLSRIKSRCYVGNKVEQTNGKNQNKTKQKNPKWEDHVRNYWDPKDMTMPWARMVVVHVVICSQTADVLKAKPTEGEKKNLNRKWELYTYTIFFPKIFFFFPVESSWLEVEAVLRWIVFQTGRSHSISVWLMRKL